MRLFYLHRDQDLSGNSGTGIVAEGVEFEDGRVAMRWRIPPRTTQLYDCLRDVEHLHGHEGRTRLVVQEASCT